MKVHADRAAREVVEARRSGGRERQVHITGACELFADQRTLRPDGEIPPQKLRVGLEPLLWSQQKLRHDE